MQREARFKPGEKKNSQRERRDRTLKTPPVILENSSSPHVPDCWTQTLEQGNDSFSQITVTARLRVHISLDRRAHSTFPLLKCNDWWSQVGLSSSFGPHNLTERGRKAKKKTKFFQPLQTSKSCTQSSKDRNKKVRICERLSKSAQSTA